MTDPTTTPTTITPGLQTTEGKGSAIVLILTVLGAVVPTVLTMLTDIATKFPSWGWVAPVIGVVSLIGAVLTAIGYGNNRTALKIAALKS